MVFSMGGKVNFRLEEKSALFAIEKFLVKTFENDFI